MNLKKLSNLLAEVTKDWYSLGVQLGLTAGKLGEMEHNNPRDAAKCMTLMLQEWQRQPNLWCTLVDALRMINKNVIAERISTKYSESFVDNNYAD